MSISDCLSLLNRLIPNKLDYERMTWDKDTCIFKHLCSNESYEKFLERNRTIIMTSSEDDLVFFKYLCQNILLKNFGQMDMETCVIFNTNSLFFDKNKKIIMVNPR